MAFSYGVQGYGVPQQDEEPPPNPFLGGGWDESQEPPPMLPQGEPFRSSGVSPDAADPFASTASAGSYEPGPQYWSPTGPINYAPDSPGMAPPAPAADPTAQAQQTAFDRVFGGGGAGGDPFTSPASRPNPDGSALSTPAALSEALRLNREQGQNDITRAQVGAVMAKGKSDFDTNTLIQQDQERAKYQAAIDQAKQVSAQKIAQYQNMKPETLFGSGSRGGNRETTIALMVLGGINDIMGNRQGQASSAMQALQIGMKQLETDDSIRFGKALTDAKSAQSDVKTLEAQREVGLAEIAHRNAARWKTVEDSVKAELAQMAPGEARVKAEQNALVIQQKSAQETQRAEVTAVDLAEKLLKLHAAQRKARAGAGGGAVDPNDPEGRYRGLNAYQRFNAEAKDKALEVETIDGEPAGRAKNPKIAQDLIDGKSAAVGLRDSLQEMQRFIKEEGTVQVPFVEAAASKRKEGILTGIAGYLTTLNKTGVLSNSEFERYSDIVDPSVFSGNEDAIKPLAELDKFVAGKYARQLQAGLQPGGAAKNPGAVQSPEMPASRAAPGYRAAAGAPAPSSGAPQEGETRTVSGHTVTFRNGRWQ